MHDPETVADIPTTAPSSPAPRATAVTSADVARAAGVSRPVVSYILNGRGERFSAQTRERVLRIARELNYHPSAAARTLVRGASEIVVALLPHTTWGGNLQDLVDVWTNDLSAVGLTLVLRFSNSSPESFDHLVRTMRPLAVMTLTRASEDDRRLLHDRGIHLVEPLLGQVERFDELVGRTQAEHLIGRGHTRLAYARLHDARQDPFGRAREAGFHDAARAHGLPEPTTLTVTIDVEQATAQLARLSLPGYGIGCYNDDVATALLSVAQQAGWRVPDDIALIGMDNTPLGALTNPPLTTIGADLRAAGPAMTSAILAAIRGEPAPEGTIEPPVPLQLIVRGTT
jgi:DNA-binding LacI/PurR family transcriptional regulator